MEGITKQQTEVVGEKRSGRAENDINRKGRWWGGVRHVIRSAGPKLVTDHQPRGAALYSQGLVRVLHP